MENDTKFDKIKPFLKDWKKDYIFKTLVSSVISFTVTILFALYNVFLGIRLLSIWHGGICVFYLLLAAIREIILLTEKNNRIISSFAFEFGIDTSYFFDGCVEKASKHGPYSCNHNGSLYNL